MPVPRAPGEFLEGEYSDDHGTRRYRLYVPSGPVEPERPLVVMLHGCTQDPEDFAAGTRANERAERVGALVLYPEQPASAHPQKCWNWFDPAHQERADGEPALLAGLTRHVVAEYDADPDRVFVAGISAGGSMAQILVATHPDLYRALAVHSAPAFRSATDVSSALKVLEAGVAEPADLGARLRDAMGARARPIPTLVLYGAVDPVVRAVNGEQVLRQWAALALGSDPEFTAAPTRAGPEASAVCPAVPGLEAEAERIEDPAPALRCLYRGGPVALEYWTVDGMGHAWSGGSPRGSYTDPAGPDATARIFDFFLGTV